MLRYVRMLKIADLKDGGQYSDDDLGGDEEVTCDNRDSIIELSIPQNGD